jgi:hypothetical protein
MKRVSSGELEKLEKAEKVQKADQPPPASDAGGKPDSIDKKHERRYTCTVRLGNVPRVCTTIDNRYPQKRVASVECFPAPNTPMYMASLNLGVKAALDEYPRRIKILNPSSQDPFPFSDKFGTEDNETYGWHTVFRAHHEAIPFLETLVLTHLPNVKGFHGLNVLSLRILEVYRLHDVTNDEFRKLAKLLPLEEFTARGCKKLSLFSVLPEDRISKTMWKLVLYFSTHQEGELRIDGDMQYMYNVQTNARCIQGRFITPRLRFFTINVRHVELLSEVLEMLKNLFTLTKKYKLDELGVEEADHEKFWSEDDTKLFCETVAAFNADYVSLTGLTQDGWRQELESYSIDFSF